MKENNNVSPKIFVGQTLYREKRDNIEEVTVTKIGKKYFYLDIFGSGHYPINKHTLEYNDKNYYDCNFKVYINKQEILYKREVLFRHPYSRCFFRCGKRRWFRIQRINHERFWRKRTSQKIRY